MERKIQKWIDENRKLGCFVNKLSDIVDSPAVDFKVGDKVTYRNNYGRRFKDRTIIGICKEQEMFKYGHCIYLDDDSYWHPVHPDNLTLQK